MNLSETDPHITTALLCHHGSDRHDNGPSNGNEIAPLISREAGSTRGAFQSLQLGYPEP